MPCLPTDRLLNLLHYVKWYLDGTLTFRRSCAHGVCGSDAMRINGVNRLACKVLMRDLLPKKPGKQLTITIEPIRGLPVEKDLVVDMEPFFDAYRAVKPYLITSGNPPTRERIQSQTDRARFDDTTKCILCACCTTTCPVYWSRGQLLRPGRDRQRPPVHLRQPRRGRRRAAGHPQRGRRRVALPHHLQLHRVLPARHPGDPGDPGGQARADVRALSAFAKRNSSRPLTRTSPAGIPFRGARLSHIGGLSRLTGMTQKTRIDPVPPQRASLLTKLMYRFAKRRFGEVPEPFAVAAHHPRLMVANGVHEMLLQSGSKKLPANVRELAVFWTARTVGCSWCVDFGSMLIRLEGLDVERLKDIDNYATSPRLHRRRARRHRLRRRHDDRPAHHHRRTGRRPARAGSATTG